MSLHSIYSKHTTSVSELKSSPSGVLKSSNGAPVAILSHNEPIGYFMSTEVFEALVEDREEAYFVNIAKKRLEEKSEFVEVKLDDL